MLLSLPRFAVRLWSSLHAEKDGGESRAPLSATTAYNGYSGSNDSGWLSPSTPEKGKGFTKTTILPVNSPLPFTPLPYSPGPIVQDKRVGGGNLFRGWRLASGKRSASRPDYVNIWGKDQDLEDDSALHTPAPTFKPAPHVVPVLQHLPFSGTLFWAPFAKLPSAFASSVGLSELYVIFAYLLVGIFALVWRSDLSTPTQTKGSGSDFARSGLVSISQLPIVVALGVRNNIIGLAVGKGYERLKRLHKVVGRFVFLAALIHAGHYCKSHHTA